MKGRTKGKPLFYGKLPILWPLESKVSGFLINSLYKGMSMICVQHGPESTSRYQANRAPHRGKEGAYVTVDSSHYNTVRNWTSAPKSHFRNAANSFNGKETQ